jgi:RNA polymerase sigma-70 factor, ECF subfamily
MRNNSLEYSAPQYPQLSDDQLLSQAKSGDQYAFGELCMRYKGILKHRIFRILRHREDTEDVLQDTFLSVYKHLHEFRKACKFSTWMTKIGINTSLMLLRRKGRLPETTSYEFETREFLDPGPNPEQNCITGQTILKLQKTIQGLSPMMRNVMDLYYGKGSSAREAAAALGITEGAAKSRILRARHMLFRSMKKQPNPEGSAAIGPRNYQKTSQVNMHSAQE